MRLVILFSMLLISLPGVATWEKLDFSASSFASLSQNGLHKIVCRYAARKKERPCLNDLVYEGEDGNPFGACVSAYLYDKKKP